MSRKQMWMSGLAAAALALFLVGCDNSDNDLNTPTSDVSGAWLYSDTGNQQTTWALVQSDDGTIDGAATDGAIINGLIEESDIQLTLTYSDDATTSVDGTVETNVMTGTYSSSTTGTGTWSAVKTD